MSEQSRQRKDYSGMEFGYLVALHQDPDDSKKYVCQCKCGRTASIRIINLISGNSKRCGNPNCITKTTDITGQRFGKLVAVEFLGLRKLAKDGRQGVAWRCKCDCGEETVVPYRSLKTGHTKSCGCYQVDVQRARMTTHGLSNTRIRRIYFDMLSRCNNPNEQSYQNYGARGVKVCPEWRESIESFAKWSFDNGYDDSLTLDRIDNDGCYGPQNCRWVTVAEQNRNKRTNHWVEIRGERMVLEDAAALFGISSTSWHYHLSQGRTDEDIIKYYERKQYDRQRFQDVIGD